MEMGILFPKQMAELDFCQEGTCNIFFSFSFSLRESVFDIHRDVRSLIFSPERIILDLRNSLCIYFASTIFHLNSSR